MNTIRKMQQSTIAPVILFMCLFGKSLTEVVERQYRIAVNNYRIADGFAEYENMRQIDCFINCTRNSSCHFISYNNDSRLCQLSDRTNGIDSMARDVGWNLFQRNEVCPLSDDDFTTNIGGHAIALCNRRLTKSDAESACASFGRLMEIPTEYMFHEIQSYLVNLPKVKNALFGKFWVAGEYQPAKNTYTLPDESPLPLTNATVHEMDASNNCAVLDYQYDYLWHDKPCHKGRSYICEKP